MPSDTALPRGKAASHGKTGLREGFTTGSAAAAAGIAAIRLLLGDTRPQVVDVPLPPGADDQGTLAVPVAGCERLHAHSALAEVVKDGGDDPDATHGAIIRCVVTLDPEGRQGHIEIEGGKGVGRVTLPGLPVEVGRAAINPEPRAQIERSVAGELLRHGYAGAARAVVEVPDGERIATRTMNPRLGIVGGISILGTRGTVRPYSHDSWRATVSQGLDVALAQGLTRVGLSTGRRSERFLMQRYPDWPVTAFVQMADFFAFSLGQIAKRLEYANAKRQEYANAQRGFREVAISCFFGKLVKMAQGCEYTHAHTAPIDFTLLAQRFQEAGADGGAVQQAAQANTARQTLAIELTDDVRLRLMDILGSLALEAARRYSDNGPLCSMHVFDFDGSLLWSGEKG